jgi:hypothetical protein
MKKGETGGPIQPFLLIVSAKLLAGLFHNL